MNSQVSKERDNDLQFLRLCFASLVWIGHSYAICFEEEPWIGSSYSIATLGVFGFFTISGFLITGSYINLNSPLKYFINRVLRIFPALIIALLLGGVLAFLTIAPESKNSDLLQPFLKYLVGNATLLDLGANSILGAFSDNRIHLVNASLWTLPVEARLYLFVGLLGWCGLLHTRAILLVFALLCIADFASLKNSVLLNVWGPPQSFYAVMFFFCGMFFKITKIELNIFLFILASGTATYSIAFHGIPWIVEIICTAYAVLYLGYRINLFRSFFNKIGDYSYGIYVYAFPIQQFVWYAANHHLGIRLTTWQLICLSGLLLWPVAILSWHFVESYFMSLKDRVFIPKKVLPSFIGAIIGGRHRK
jgi:peptidoglycan/LPS O-acetylase OafA/YrhL